MRLAIVSDLHLGDAMCTVVSRNAAGAYVPGAKMPYLLQQLGSGLDYLVLAGDTIDLSVASYQDAYTAARVLFSEIARAGVAREIVFVPGNHDFAIWHILMHEINVIRRLTQGQPIATRHSCPGVIDDRPSAPNRGRLELPYVSRNPSGRYGGIYLQSLMPANSDITVNVAYPNLYVVDANGQTTLITHGHYLDTFWALTGELGKEVAGPDLRFAAGSFMDVDDFVSINFPLAELTSSGIGQAGALTLVVRAIQREYKDRNYERIRRYLNNARGFVDRYFAYKGLLGRVKEELSDKAIDVAKDWLLERIEGSNPARYDDQFADKSETQDRFRRYYIASTLETQKIAAAASLQEIPAMSSVIFGHTHEYVAWGSRDAPAHFVESANRLVRLYNTGGWLTRPGEAPGAAVGGGVFSYATARGFSSTTDTSVRPIVYADVNFAGQSQELDPGGYADLKIGNDVVSSARVPPGWRVTLFEHVNFKGSSRVLTSDSPSLDGFNDKATSVVVERTA